MRAEETQAWDVISDDGGLRYGVVVALTTEASSDKPYFAISVNSFDVAFFKSPNEAAQWVLEQENQGDVR